MPIDPDTKDWTWVLQRRCPACDFDATTFDVADTPAALRANAAVWWTVLTRPDVRTRPNESTWSPLEYACHVRDVFEVFHHRLLAILQDDDPAFPNWDQDATAVHRRYEEQDPSVVASDLIAAAEILAATFERVRAEQWSRTGQRSDGVRFTVSSLARYLMHDPTHHLHDVGAA